MHAVPDPPGTTPVPDEATVPEKLTKLRGDFKEWHVQYVSEVMPLPWEARRSPLRFPHRGGFAWVRAESDGRLRELLVAAGEIEDDR